ncbi:MAG: ChaN family lipoprotein [Deltaproteobacteria bacterium]|nr:ChaN family lipoprotein [Deltaproteobacteria bacterium]
MKIGPARLLPVLLLSACAAAAPPAEDYLSVRPLEFGGRLILPGGDLLEENSFQSFFRNADYILIGETHDNLMDHASQAAILEKLARNRLRPVVGLEALDVDSQPELDRFNAGDFSKNPDALETALAWSKNGGNSFDWYRPLLELAARENIPLYALNLPRRVVRTARLRGFTEVEEEDRKYLPRNFMPAPWEQQIKLREFFRRHLEISGPTGDSPEERQKALDGYILAQALWDSAMAERAGRIHAETGRPVVIIAGSGHVEYGWGIALRLRAREPGARIISILPWRSPLEKLPLSDEWKITPERGGQDSFEFPPPQMSDAYYYSPPEPVGKGYGMVTWSGPEGARARLVVLEVEAGGKAEKAGLKAGDVILGLAGRKMESNADLYNLLAQFAAYSTPARITVRRFFQKLDITLYM